MLSVIVPAYQEGPHIFKALQALLEALDALDQDYEVIVVSDGNVDSTVDEALRLGSENVNVIHYSNQRGKGYALRSGFKTARGDTVAFIDADMELHPSGIGVLLSILRDTGADAVFGSKVHPDSKVFYPRFRRFQSHVFGYIVRLLFRLQIEDTQTGLKVFRRELLDVLMPQLDSDGFAFDLELSVLANDAGYHIVEGPVELDYQFASTTGAFVVFEVLWDVARIAIRRSRRSRASAASQINRGI